MMHSEWVLNIQQHANSTDIKNLYLLRYKGKFGFTDLPFKSYLNPPGCVHDVKKFTQSKYDQLQLWSNWSYFDSGLELVTCHT
jgi:hypothetical protein